MDIELYTEIFRKKESIGTPRNLEEIKHALLTLKNGYEENYILNEVIAYYLYNQVSTPDRRRRKVTARNFEDFLAVLLNGFVTDKESRENMAISEIKNMDKFISGYISSNRREKIDIKFGDNYGVSVKTSVLSNTEINMGSFAREALFHDILNEEEIGSERRGGLGSRPQLEEKFELIKTKGLYEKFSNRFSKMVRNIFVDDLIYIIKGEGYIDWYLINKDVLQQELINRVSLSPQKAITIINRYEGNSIRIDRGPILEKVEVIKLDLNDIHNKTIYKLLEDLENFSDEIIISIIEKNDKDLENKFETRLNRITSNFFN